MFYIVIFLLKKWAIRSFPHFCWAMWANRSSPSPKMTNVSKSLMLLTKNEQIACFFERIAYSLIFSQKTSDSLRNPMSKFPALIFFEQPEQLNSIVYNVISFLSNLILTRCCEQIVLKWQKKLCSSVKMFLTLSTQVSTDKVYLNVRPIIHGKEPTMWKYCISRANIMFNFIAHPYLQGTAMSLTILSSARLGASTKVCLQVAHCIVFFSALQLRQYTWPFLQ